MSVFTQDGDAPVSIFSTPSKVDTRWVIRLDEIMPARTVRRITSELQVYSDAFSRSAVMVECAVSTEKKAVVIFCFLPLTVAQRGYDSVPMANRLHQAAKTLAALGYNDVTRHPSPQFRIPTPAMPSPYYGLAGSSLDCRSENAAAGQALALLEMGHSVWRINQDAAWRPWSHKNSPIIPVTQDDVDAYFAALDDEL